MDSIQTDVLIIGGGLAGLTSALHLHKNGISCVVVEKNAYPHHKVCGEYLSKEVIPYLETLNINLELKLPPHISRFQLSTVSSKKDLYVTLPLGGIGISRYALDYLFYKELVQKGIPVMQDTVTDVSFNENSFEAKTSNNITFKAKQVLGAYGKRGALDVKLERPFMKEKSQFLAIKAHFKGTFPDDLIALHYFDGGYCGVSMVEDQTVNMCYLTDYRSFKNDKNIEDFQKNVLFKNPHLAQLFNECEIIFEEPITISQLYFNDKETVKNHILMIGDTAALIHPLCGNGMAIAIHSAKIASELITDYFEGKICSREELEKIYTKKWRQAFNFRLKAGRMIATVFRQKKLTNILMNILIKLPFVVRAIIKQTHGKPLTSKKC